MSPLSGKIAPSLTVRPAEHPVNANVSLRGVGTFAFGIGVEPSVAVLVDEVPLAFQARAFTDLPDVERIEVRYVRQPVGHPPVLFASGLRPGRCFVD